MEGPAASVLATPTMPGEQGIAYVPPDRRRQGLVPSQGITENLTLSALRSLAVGGMDPTSAPGDGSRKPGAGGSRWPPRACLSP